MKRKPEIVVLSDVHLGTFGCHAKELHRYLKSIQPQILILNGDFIDIWSFRKHYFPKEHLQVIRRILKMATTGTKVYYITGNHDDALRAYSDFNSGNIFLRDKLELQLNGKSYWIFHGDIFDVFIKYSPFLAKLGGISYDWLIYLNRGVNRLRSFLGLARMSFTKKIKDRVKKAVSFIKDFEDHAIRMGINKGFDYVICGHIHQPKIKEVSTEEGSITYLNSGDWVENLTALEYRWGEWTLYEYREEDFLSMASDAPGRKAERVKDMERLGKEGDLNREEPFQQVVKPSS